MNVQVNMSKEFENEDWDDISYDDNSSPLKSNNNDNENTENNIEENNKDKIKKIDNDSDDENIIQTKLNKNDLQVISEELKIIKVNVQILLDKIITLESIVNKLDNHNENRHNIRYNCTNILKKKLKIF